MNAKGSFAVVFVLALAACVVVMDPFRGGMMKGRMVVVGSPAVHPGATSGGSVTEDQPGGPAKSVEPPPAAVPPSPHTNSGKVHDPSPSHLVAIIIAGGLRTFSVVQESMLENVVKALQPQPHLRQVFFEVSTTPDCHAASVNKRVANYVPRCEAQYKAYNEGYFESPEFKQNWSNPIVWQTNALNCKHDSLKPLQCCIKYPYSDQDHPTGFLGFMSYARRSIAIGKVMDYSKRTGKNFSWIAVVRPDLYFFEPMPPASYFASLPPRLYLASKEMGQGPGDYLYIFPGSMLETMQWALIDVFEKWCIENNPYMNTGPPEGRVHVQWTARKVGLQVFPFSFAITRSQDSADCFRINNEAWRGHISGYDEKSNGISAEQQCKKRFPNAFDPR